MNAKTIIRCLAAAVLVPAFGAVVTGCVASGSDGVDELDGMQGDNTPDDEGESSSDTSQEELSWWTHKRCESPGGWGEPICVAWTGSWPSGYVRAESRSSYYYAIMLQGCSGNDHTACDARTIVASKTLHNHAGYTPSVRVGKYSWYVACAKRFASSRWACNRGMYQVYLGD